MFLFETINNLNREKVKNTINSSITFKWEDNELVNILTGKLDNYYLYQHEKNEKYIKELYKCELEINSKIKDFNERAINAKEFIRFIKNIIKYMENKYQSINFNRLNAYITKVKIYESVLIYGIGGIGKSRFIYELENVLNSSNIAHFFVYGKYQKSVEKEVINEIKNIALKKEFVFAFDAINELSLSERNKIYDQLLSLSEIDNIRIIVTYRKNTLRNKEIKKWYDLLKTDFFFQGVDYEHSMEMLIERFGVNALKYHEIVSTNNPQYILMLVKLLDHKKISENKIGSVAQLTYLYEQYIKNFCNRKEWEITKSIADYMFINCKTSIAEEQLKIIAGSEFENYIELMMQQGLIDFYNYDKKRFFIFKIENLSNFLISRSFFNFMKNMDKTEIIKLIDTKFESGLHGIQEPLIVVLFDKFKDNIKIAFEIIKDSKLDVFFQHEYLRYVVFKDKKAIESAKKYIVLNDNDINHIFSIFAGLIAQPFNATNYCTEYLLKNKQIQLSVLTGYYIDERELILKCRNAIYLINMVNCSDEYLQEFFWMSLWCSSSKNPYLRANAEKLLFDITDNNIFYINKLIDIFYKIYDDYIRMTIIDVLANVSKNYDYIVNEFLENIYNCKEEINAHIIISIERRLYSVGHYIERTCTNINSFITAIKPSEDLHKVLLTTDHLFKDLLLFSYGYGENYKITLNNNFIFANKNKVKEWNNQIYKKFICVKEGDCCGGGWIEDIIKKQLKPNFSLKPINSKNLFLCFQYVWNQIVKKYEFNDINNFNFDRNSNNTILKKILTITKELFYGSLMCNYYTDNFETFNGDFNTIGYTQYYPIDYSDAPSFLSPISIYSNDIEKLNDNLISLIYDDNLVKDEEWANNRVDVIEKVKKLTNSIFYNGFEWKLLSGDINLRINDTNSEMVSNECYILNLSFNPKKTLTGHSDRYLTIESELYKGNIKDYSLYDNCYLMNIKHNSMLKNEDVTTTLKFPPSNIINLFNLKFNIVKSAWENTDKEIIVFCDNNKYHWYRSNIIYASYIRKDYFDKLVENGIIKYFIFTERFLKGFGYVNNTSLHIELDLNKTIKIFENYNHSQNAQVINSKCLECKIYKENKRKNSLYLKHLEEFLKVPFED